jgi:hypothetical protein
MTQPQRESELVLDDLVGRMVEDVETVLCMKARTNCQHPRRQNAVRGTKDLENNPGEHGWGGRSWE